VAKEQEKVMARNRRMLWMGLAAAMLAGSAEAQGDCKREDGTVNPDCLQALAGGGCGGATGPTLWCEPIVDGRLRIGWAGFEPLENASLWDRALAMIQYQGGDALATQPAEIRIGPLFQPEAGIEPPPQQFRRAGGRSLATGHTIAYLASPVFGGVLREANHQGPAYAVRLDSPALNGKPDALVVATRVRLPWSTRSTTGAYYDGAYWWLYNESLEPMAENEMFFFAEATGKGGRAVRSAQNDFAGIGVYLDDPRLNGNPGAVFVAQHVFGGQLNASPLAAWYDAARGQWAVFNVFGTPLAASEQIHYMTAH
jgi:hypothetical protein